MQTKKTAKAKKSNSIKAKMKKTSFRNVLVSATATGSHKLIPPLVQLLYKKVLNKDFFSPGITSVMKQQTNSSNNLLNTSSDIVVIQNRKLPHETSKNALKSMPFSTYASCIDSNLPLPLKQCIQRIHKDLDDIRKNPLHGIFAAPDPNFVHICHAIIVGPEGTPYENGFFHFTLNFPDNYPFSPPTVTLQNTGGGKVRFNPNLYKNGKVCLSILGTWAGPGWHPSQSIASILLSIQSIMNEFPYYNEPGYERTRNYGQVKNYNNCIRYETLRIAVVDMIKSERKYNLLPEVLVHILRKMFLERIDRYVNTCDDYLHMDGRKLEDPFCDNKGIFQYQRVKESIEELRRHYELEAKVKG